LWHAPLLPSWSKMSTNGMLSSNMCVNLGLTRNFLWPPKHKQAFSHMQLYNPLDKQQCHVYDITNIWHKWHNIPNKLNLVLQFLFTLKFKQKNKHTLDYVAFLCFFTHLSFKNIKQKRLKILRTFNI
jgi:hypothetical protein